MKNYNSYVRWTRYTPDLWDVAVKRCDERTLARKLENE